MNRPCDKCIDKDATTKIDDNYYCDSCNVIDEATKLYELGVEYHEAWTAAVEGDDAEAVCVDLNDEYSSDKCPALVGDLFGDLSADEAADLGVEIFAPTEGITAPGRGFSAEQVAAIIVDYFTARLARHPSPE